MIQDNPLSLFNRKSFRKLLQQLRRKLNLSLKPPTQVFDEIYRKNVWGDRESASGPGSRMDRTDKVRRVLPILIEQYGYRSILDIPCGDFNWMKTLELKVEYIGADIVAALVKRNQEIHGSDRRRFVELNLLADRLPSVDLIFCRDCLVHFSNRDVRLALKNIKASGSKYLLTTTFAERTENQNIVTGEWRALNLSIPPFRLSPPLELVEDSYNSPNYFDKHLGLWKISDLPNL